MNDQEKQALRTLRDKYVAEAQRQLGLAALLSAELGEPPPVGGGVPVDLLAGLTGTNGGAIGADPVEGTAHGEYLNFNSTDAAYAILTKFGSRQNPLKTRQIYDALKKGGVQLSMEQALYRSLARSHRFKKAGPGSWGLAEWYPKDKTRTVKNADGTVTELPVTDDDPEADDGEPVEIEEGHHPSGQEPPAATGAA